MAQSNLNTMKVTVAALTRIWDFTKSHLGNIVDLAHCSSNDPGKDQPGE